MKNAFLLRIASAVRSIIIKNVASKMLCIQCLACNVQDIECTTHCPKVSNGEYLPGVVNSETEKPFNVSKHF